MAVFQLRFQMLAILRRRLGRQRFRRQDGIDLQFAKNILRLFA